MAQIVRSGGAGEWKQGKYNKTRFYKLPTQMAMCAPNSSGYYLFNQVTKGADYYVHGDSVNDIRTWFRERSGSSGFRNKMWNTVTDFTGQQPDAIGDSLLYQLRDFKGYGGPRVPVGKPTYNTKCAYCDKHLKKQNWGSIKKAQRRKQRVLEDNQWFCSSKCAQLKFQEAFDEEYGTEFPHQGAAAAAFVENPRPQETPIKVEDVPRQIYVAAAFLTVGTGKMQELEVGLNVFKQLVSAAASFAPGGSANVVGEIVVDSVSNLNDLADNVRTHILQRGDSKPVGLRPALRFSVLNSEGSSLGSGTNNDGIVTFDALLGSTGYERAISTLADMVR